MPISIITPTRPVVIQAITSASKSNADAVVLTGGLKTTKFYKNTSTVYVWEKTDVKNYPVTRLSHCV